MASHQIEMKNLELRIREQLAREHDWDQQVQHRQEQEKHWYWQRHYWSGIAILGLATILIQIFIAWDTIKA